MPKPNQTAALAWPPLTAGTLIRRYKRFLADVRLDDGRTVTAHCPNSGAMTACCQAGRPVYLSYHDNPRRKLAFTWELIDMPTSLVGVNTLVPNRLVAQAARHAAIDELAGYDQVRTEVKVSAHSRLDLMLTSSRKPDAFVEVKNCTLVEERLARFPDAQTSRGRKHLEELQRLVIDGHRAVMFFLIQRADADAFAPADDIDPAYGRGLRKAVAAGVQAIAYDVCIDLQQITLGKRLPIRL